MARFKLDYPVYLFNEGTNYDAFKLMRLSYLTKGGKKVWRFRCWAPRAKSVSVVGNFNKWNRNINKMVAVGGGLWEAHIGGLKKYDNYKFSVEGAKGKVSLKADPYATHAETAPGTASKVYDIAGYNWGDSDYLLKRKERNHYTSPMNVYEVHAGSWKKHADGNFYSYKDLADSLVPYLKEMNYTHVELMPVTEHPFFGSWGYQISGLFAPTSRFGIPHEFMYFVDKCHKAGIGVIMDFVLSHFPKDEFGLYEFDGLPLYEYTDECKKEHKEWGTHVFDYGRPEVHSFLISAVCFWLEHYHIDGMRLDAVASMLYLDYNRKDGEWAQNIHGGNHNLEAIAFLQKLNRVVLSRFPDCFMVAEESTAFPMVTMPPDIGGLGFNFKWNMGWMNDILEYVGIDPFFRKGAHDKITFSLSYAFSENYVLPFSHDEVVHGKCSMVSKVRGDYQDKFSALKALYAYQMAHPGKKLNFMGGEFAQFIEWDYQKELDWLLLEFESHITLKNYVKKLNELYLKIPALFELDNTYDGFKWLVVDDNVQNVIAFYREDKEHKKLISIINFANARREGYEIGVPDAGDYEIVLNSNATDFGGKTEIPKIISTVKKPNHGHKNSIVLNIEPNSALYLTLKKRA
ncbi:MAG: 1,4-alpha-glucan branching protein GlgB [Firmicutes bacterium]|nr:1,4-alpha-glucan branching protein GlgB [Bacillota bacterium]